MHFIQSQQILLETDSFILFYYIIDLLPRNGGQILKELLHDANCDIKRFKSYNGQEMRDDDFLHVR